MSRISKWIHISAELAPSVVNQDSFCFNLMSTLTRNHSPVLRKWRRSEIQANHCQKFTKNGRKTALSASKTRFPWFSWRLRVIWMHNRIKCHTHSPSDLSCSHTHLQALENSKQLKLLCRKSANGIYITSLKIRTHTYTCIQNIRSCTRGGVRCRENTPCVLWMQQSAVS